MPLEQGASRQTISRNISEMVHAGHPQNQAIAAAMRAARQSRQDGGENQPLTTRPVTRAVRYPMQQVQDFHQSLPGTMDSPNVGGLESAFSQAIAHHLSLDPVAQRANSQRAAAIVAQHIGPTGKLLGKNIKMKKASGYRQYEPVLLPDGRGVETTGVTLSPSMQVGRFNTCPNSASCRDGCLGVTAGHNWVQGSKEEGVVKGPGVAQANKAMGMLRNPEAFAVALHDQIGAAKQKAAESGNHLGVRLNVLSDINPRIHKAIIDAHPDVDFYDYTKNNGEPVGEASNHHYTYSSTGVSQPAGENGLVQGVHNPHQNWKQMRKRLDQGSNVAMAFSHKKFLPESVYDHESGKTYRVIDGDTHDFRPIDRQPQGSDGVIVGLRNKNRKDPPGEPAVHAQSGFFVHYDPQETKARTLKGQRIPSVPTNTQVAIHPQNQGLREADNDAYLANVATPRVHTLISRRRAFGGGTLGHITEHEWSPEAYFQQFPHAHLYTEDDLRPARAEGGEVDAPWDDSGDAPESEAAYHDLRPWHWGLTPLQKMRAKSAMASGMSTADAVKHVQGRPKRAGGGHQMHASKPMLFHSNVRHHLHVGPIHSHVSGRTDHLNMHVPSGSYVLPADVVSAHGEGNTIAGFKVMRRLFGGGPYGSGDSGPYSQGSGPYGEPLQNKAFGGEVRNQQVMFHDNAPATRVREVVDNARPMQAEIPGAPPQQIARGLVDPAGKHVWWDAAKAIHHDAGAHLKATGFFGPDFANDESNRLEAERDHNGVLQIKGGGRQYLPEKFKERHRGWQVREKEASDAAKAASIRAQMGSMFSREDDDMVGIDDPSFRAFGGEVNGKRVNFHKNPSAKQVVRLRERSPHGILRGIVNGPDHYWWNAHDAIHHDAAQALGIPYNLSNRLEAYKDREGLSQIGGASHNLPQPFQDAHDAIRLDEWNNPPADSSRGGQRTDHGDEGVPIVAAGGEYVLSPDQVRAAGNGDPELGCRVLDEFVKRSRAKNITTLKGLPGPARD